MVRSPAETLAIQLQSVFAPALLQSLSGKGRVLDEGIRGMLQDLRVGLLNQIARDEGTDKSTGGIESPFGILSLVDEHSFWKALTSENSRYRGCAQVYCMILERCLREFQALQDGTLSLNAALELLVDSESLFHSLWTGKHQDIQLRSSDLYPSVRMRHLFGVVEASVVGFIQKKGSAIDLWSLPLQDARYWLETALSLCDEWTQLVQRLCQHAWSPRYPESRPWEGPQPVPTLLEGLRARLLALQRLYLGHAELLLLVQDKPHLAQSLRAAVEPLRGAAALYVSPATQTVWEAGVEEYQRLCSPIESEAGGVLSQLLQSASDQPVAVVRLLHSFQNLRTRQGIAPYLSVGYDAVLSHLQQHLPPLAKAVQQRVPIATTGRGVHDPEATSAQVEVLVQCSIQKARLLQLQHIVNELDKGMANTKAGNAPLTRELRTAIDDLLLRLEKKQKDIFSEWVFTYEQYIAQGKLSLQNSASSGILQLSDTKQLSVTHAELLFQFLRDVRKVQELGFVLPAQLSQLATQTAHTRRFFSSLLQVAAQYNTIEHGIAPGMKPLLTTAVTKFEQALQPALSAGPTSIGWTSQERALAAFVRDLSRASQQLQDANKALRITHSQISDLVARMFQIDLIQERARMTQLWRAVAHTAMELVRQHPPEISLQWTSFWDAQLCKAVGCVFSIGLEKLSESIEERKIELHYHPSTQTVQFRPSLEDAKALYYTDLQAFLTYPLTLHPPCISRTRDAYAQFQVLPYRSAASVARVYHTAEVLFARLAKFKEAMHPHTALLRHVADFPAFVETACRTLEDFHSAFEQIREKRKSLDHLVPDFAPIDCFRVSSVPLKQAIDRHLTSLLEACALALRRNLLQKASELDEFLKRGESLLDGRTDTLEALTNAGGVLREIANGRDRFETDCHELERARQVLVREGTGVIDLSEINARAQGLAHRWNALQLGLEAFKGVLEGQKAVHKDRVSREAEEVARRAQRLQARWRQAKPSAPAHWTAAEVQEILDAAQEWDMQLKGLKKATETVKNSAEAFGVSVPEFTEITSLEAEIQKFQDEWMLWKEYAKEKAVFAEQDWYTFRPNMFTLQDFATKWLEKTKQEYTSQNSTPNSGVAPILDRIASEADHTQRAMSGFRCLRSDAFRDEHWSQCFARLGLPRGTRINTLTIGQFLKLEVLQALDENVDFLKELHAKALGESTIREGMQDVKAWMDTTEWTFSMHVSNATKQETPLVSDTKRVLSGLGDTRSLLNSLKDSPFFRPFAEQAQVYEAQFGVLDEAIHLLISVQRRWAYLEGVFATNALPSAMNKFNTVNTNLRSMLQVLKSDPKVMTLADSSLFPNVAESLTVMNDQLEQCQRALLEFLEEKRSQQPRFYFIGDEALLEMLGNASTPYLFQDHMKKLYQGIARVLFEDDIYPVPEPSGSGAGATKGAAIGRKVTPAVAMQSALGEVVPFASPVSATADICAWIRSISVQMQRTLDLLTGLGLQHIQRSPSDWEARLALFPSQVLGLVECIHFTHKVESILRAKGSFDALIKEYQQALVQLTNYSASEHLSKLQSMHEVQFGRELGSDIPSPPRPTEKLLRSKIKNLVFDTIHRLSILALLQKEQSISVDHWLWLKQLRYYYTPQSNGITDKTSSVVARIAGVELPYGFEYQGNATKLVHTPLTDKAYVSFCVGLYHGLGGNPYGPAGTGKTETVKALGMALGKQVLVFNCDEGIDFASIGRIFIGLCKQGAWGCFDEFNRLREDQLSAISGQIQRIQIGMKPGAGPITLLNQSLTVRPGTGIFVTLNPVGKGYGGRSELPHNLKALFRPVAMTVPDNATIAEVSLVSDGFAHAATLGKKVTTFFTVAKQLLSVQGHYDWGLRAIKACLNFAGGILSRRRSEFRRQNPTEKFQLSPREEQDIVVQAVRVNTVSKLTAADLEKFDRLLQDIFPYSKDQVLSDAVIEACVRKVVTEPPFNFTFDEEQAREVLLLKEAFDQRIGCILIGPSGSGKTSLWRVLAAALRSIGEAVHVHAINPKSLSRRALLGYLDPDTHEWTDGVLTSIARTVTSQPADTRNWVVFDGDVDPEWIEALNSVLDDNRLLSIPNGERISFGSNVNFLFETQSLEFASPATVSRCGLLYLSAKTSDLKRIINARLLQVPESVRSTMSSLIDAYLLRSVQWYQKAQKTIGAQEGKDAVLDVSASATVLNCLDHLLPLPTKDTPVDTLVYPTVKPAFGHALLLSFGALMRQDVFAQYRKELEEWMDTRIPPLSVLPSGAEFPFPMPQPLTLEHLHQRTPVAAPSFSTWCQVVQPWVHAGRHCLLVGPEGVGRSALVRHLVRSTPRTGLVEHTFTASSHPEQVVQLLKQSCILVSGASGRVLRPKGHEKLVVLLRDITVPVRDKYNTSSVIALLHQLCAYNGFFDTNREFLGLERVQIVVTMAPPGTAGKQPLCNRFLSNLRVLQLHPLPQQELVTVLEKYLGTLFQALHGTPIDPLFHGSALETTLRKVAACLVELFTFVSSSFTSDQHCAFQFPLRLLPLWVQNLTRYPLAAEPSILQCVLFEANALFRARLTPSHQATYDAQAVSIFRGQFRVNVAPMRFVPGERVYSTVAGRAVAAVAGGSSAAANKEPLHKCTGYPYARLTYEEVQQAIQRSATTLSREEMELQLSLQPSVLELHNQIDAALTRNAGSVFLLGPPGTGKKTSVRLFAHRHTWNWHTPSIGAQYSFKSFCNELKPLLTKVALENAPAVLYFEDIHFDAKAQLPRGLDSSEVSMDTALIYEAALELLESRYLSQLFTHEETEALYSSLRDQIAANSNASFPCLTPEGTFPSTPKELLRARLHTSLRVVVSLNTRNDEFVARVMTSPQLVTRCTVIHVPEWESSLVNSVLQDQMTEAIQDIVKKRKKEAKDNHNTAEQDGSVEEEWLQQIPQLLKLAQLMYSVAETESKSGALSKESGSKPVTLHFSFFVRYFCALLQQHSEKSKAEIRRLRRGLSQLANAERTVDELNAEMEVQKVEIMKKQAQADAAMKGITDALSSASEAREQAEELSKNAAKAQENTKERKAIIEAELAKVLPVLEAAQKAVGNIKKENLDEIRALKMPPEPIANVLSAVLLLLGVVDTSWQSMKRVLSNRGVIQDILSFDARTMSPTTRDEVVKVLKAKADSFRHEVIYRASVAAAPLAAWVKANIEYSYVLEKITPLEQDLNMASDALQSATHNLHRAQGDLRTVDQRVSALKDEFAKFTGEAEALKAQLRITEEKADKAKALLSALAGERSRWVARLEDLQQQTRLLPRTLLYVAGFALFAGGYNEEGRGHLRRSWASAFQQDRFCQPLAVGDVSSDMVKLMTTAAELLNWRAEGLPMDSVAQENAVLLSTALKSLDVPTPYVLDSMNTGYEWIMAHLKKKQELMADASTPFETVSFLDEKFLHTLELAIRFGRVLVVRDMNIIPGGLLPLLRREFNSVNGRQSVKLGEKYIDVSDKFRLVLFTQSTAPLISNTLYSSVTPISFSVTLAGLQSQFQSFILQTEQPHMEKQKAELLAQEEEYTRRLEAGENQLLSALADASGNILENAPLLNSLTTTKKEAASIQLALEQSEASSRALDFERERYKPLADAAATLFFALKDLSLLSSLYRTGLSAFKTLFRKVLSGDLNGFDESVPLSLDASEKVRTLIPVLYRCALRSFLRGVAHADLAPAQLALANRLFPDAFRVASYRGPVAASPEWQFFLGNAPPVTDAAAGVPAWVPTPSRTRFAAFLQTNSSVAKTFQLQNGGLWEPWLRLPEPETAFPSELHPHNNNSSAGTAWQRVLLVSVLRPDRAATALDHFLRTLYQWPSGSGGGGGSGYRPLANHPKDLWRETAPDTPVVYFVAPGTNPTAELADLAAASVPAIPYTEVTMGWGMGSKAMESIVDAAAAGGWVCLKNVHLVLPWLSTVQQWLVSRKNALHTNFRLWVSGEKTGVWPVGFLESAVKIYVEPTPGFKNNLLQTLTVESNSTSNATPLHTRFYFLLSCLHAILLGRLTYVPRGWTSAYEFSDADKAFAVTLVQDLLKEKDISSLAQTPNFPWKRLYGLLEFAVYGGRIDNNYDRQALESFLHRLFNQKTTNSSQLPVPSLPPLPTTLQSLPDYVSYIKTLPDATTPALLSLPSDVELSLQVTTWNNLVSKQQSLHARATETNLANAPTTPDELSALLHPVLQSWSQIYKQISPLFASNTQVPGSDPVSLFVTAERKFGKHLASQVSSTLMGAQKVLHAKGAVPPSLRSLVLTLSKGQVPDIWLSLWDPQMPDENVSTWMQAFLRRVVALENWVAAAQSNGQSLLHVPVAFTTFFHPNAFLSSLRQASAQSFLAPDASDAIVAGAESLVLITTPDARLAKSYFQSNRLSVFAQIENVAVQGAVWNEQTMLLQDPAVQGAHAKSSFSLYVAWVPPNMKAFYDKQSTVALPLYLESDRKDTLCEVHLPIPQEVDASQSFESPKEKWIAYGTALIANM